MLVSWFFSIASLFWVFFLKWDFIAPSIVIFCISFVVFLIFSVPRWVSFLLKKENTRFSKRLFWSCIFVLYAFLAGILWGTNPFLLWFFLLWGLLFSWAIFLFFGGFIIIELLKHSFKINILKIVKTLKIKLWILFLTFPFVYSAVSKMIGKEKTEISFMIASSVLLFLIFWWKHIIKYSLELWELLKSYFNEKRVRNISSLSSKKTKEYFERKDVWWVNLKHSNNFINTQRLKKWYIREILLGYLQNLCLVFFIWFIAGVDTTIKTETNWFFLSLWLGGFATLAVALCMLFLWPVNYKSIIEELKNSLSLDANANRYFRVNKNTIYFIKK